MADDEKYWDRHPSIEGRWRLRTARGVMSRMENPEEHVLLEEIERLREELRAVKEEASWQETLRVAEEI